MLFDVAMPLTLFFVTLVSMLLNGKTESRLKTSLEEKTFAARDAVMLVIAMVAMISLIVYLPEMALMIVFMFSYSMLLFLFTLVFLKKRWYLAILPPALFVGLYAFTHTMPIWTVYLINVYAVVFAIMITLYLQTLFTWKTSLIFTGLLTIADIILVLGTKTMVSAATQTRSLNLPVLVAVPTLPTIILNEKEIIMQLGLGDFFFAGLLTIQSMKQYGKRFALYSLIGMTVSFMITESLLFTFKVGAFPGTVMIIAGWLPLIAMKTISERLKHRVPAKSEPSSVTSHA